MTSKERTLLESARDALRNAGPVTRELVASRIDAALSGSPVPETDSDEPLIVAIGAVQKYADNYVERYELATDAGEYTPSERERGLITDAVNGLIADEDFLRLVRTEVVETEKRRATLGECIVCARALPDHWGGCSAAETPCEHPLGELFYHGFVSGRVGDYRCNRCDMVIYLPGLDAREWAAARAEFKLGALKASAHTETAAVQAFMYCPGAGLLRCEHRDCIDNGCRLVRDGSCSGRAIQAETLVKARELNTELRRAVKTTTSQTDGEPA